MTATDELCRENERLRQQVASIIGRSFRTADKMDCLERENAKLRELVRDMWPHVRHRSKMCNACDLDCSTSSECLLYEPMRDRMRELGIEVDG